MKELINILRNFMTKVFGPSDRSDSEILIARIRENYNLVADGNLADVRNLGVNVPSAGDYLIEGLAIMTVDELTDGIFAVHVSSGTMVSDFTVNDPTNALDQVQVQDNNSTVSLAQGQHAWRVIGTVFGISSGGLIQMRLGQQSGKAPFLVLRGGFLRVTKLD